MKVGIQRYLLSVAITFMLVSCAQKVVPPSNEQLPHASSWQSLGNYPLKDGRTDDIYFVTSQLGWAVNSTGALSKTVNGGETWDVQFRRESSFFRCLAFSDSLHGWIGTLGQGDKYLHSSDSVVLYETTNGGKDWSPTKISGPYPAGLCGIQKVSDQVLIACGRVRGPSYFLKSIDGGITWESKDMNHLAGSLIAPHFFDENNGLLLGGTTRDKVTCRSLILATTDGGNSWDTLYVSKSKGEYLWKASFPSQQIGYISVQQNIGRKSYYLKTTNGGKSWKRRMYTKKRYLAQGIGFLNEDVGWIGGSWEFTFETRDGGKSWQAVSNAGKGLNNFQFINDSTAYAVGQGVYKMNMNGIELGN